MASRSEESPSTFRHQTVWSSAASPSPTPKSGKVCGVCGDRAKSYHFGGISCDSCKAFFRRSVQNDAYRNFQCPYEKRCDISVTSRKCCQYCRFQKCTSIGMEKSWVMTEEERMLLLRQRMEKKARLESQVQDPAKEMEQTDLPPSRKELECPIPVVPYDSNIGTIGKYLSDDEVRTINNLIRSYEESYHEVPYHEKLKENNINRPKVEIIAMFTTFVKRLAHLTTKLDFFKTLNSEDQATLLRCGMMELCLLRLAYSYDVTNNCWPDVRIPLYRSCPIVRAEDLQRFLPVDLFESHMRFNKGIQELNLNETCVILLMMTALFSPERSGLERTEMVQQLQEKFFMTLRRYMSWRYGAEEASSLYPRVLLKLTDLRELNDAHVHHTVRLGFDEVDSMKSWVGFVPRSCSDHDPPDTSNYVTSSETVSSLTSVPYEKGQRRRSSTVTHTVTSSDMTSEYTSQTSSSYGAPSRVVSSPTLHEKATAKTLYESENVGAFTQRPQEGLRSLSHYQDQHIILTQHCKVSGNGIPTKRARYSSPRTTTPDQGPQSTGSDNSKHSS